MLQKYSFFCIFAVLLVGLHWWSVRVNPVSQSPAEIETQRNRAEGLISASRVIARQDLIETLDRLVMAQNEYHSIHGYYTKVLSNIGFSLPSEVSQHYEIRVVDAGKSNLQISAFSEDQGQVQDSASIDQAFQLNANFPIPLPRPEYLELHAYQHMNLLNQGGLENPLAERGVFTGYFRYEVKRDSEGRSVAFAIGLKAPVLGVQLESVENSTHTFSQRGLSMPRESRSIASQPQVPFSSPGTSGDLIIESITQTTENIYNPASSHPTEVR